MTSRCKIEELKELDSSDLKITFPTEEFDEDEANEHDFEFEREALRLLGIVVVVGTGIGIFTGY